MEVIQDQKPEGLARLADQRPFTAYPLERAKARHRAEVGRQIMRELKEIEQWALDHGHLDKNWRDTFK